jgi:Subtilase family
MRRRHLILVLGFAATAMLGYWLARSAVPEKTVVKKPPSADSGPRRTVVVDDTVPRFRSGERPSSAFRRDDEAADAGALPGQRVVIFKDSASLEEFLKRAGDRIRLLGRLDKLNALRLGFLNPDDLASLLDGDEETSLIYPVDTPAPGDASAQPGAEALGAGLLDWLGITGDNSAWGEGVRVAVLDTGVASSSAFNTSISSVNLVGLPSDPSAQNGHGTAVASMIIGDNPLTPGVAPGAEMLSFRIANDLGQSDSFLLAQGIIAAVDSGADLINISMASAGDSGLVRNAIAYARAAGALIIAAAGNNGTDRVSYPAANEGVIAVGAVDAAGNHLDFSNQGQQVAISAPGFGVNAAWTGDQAVSVNGTSFSSPIIAGAIAALMSQPGVPRMTARQAADLLFQYLNDGGEAGSDRALGAGMPDLGRVLNRNTRGYYDAAVASQRIIPPSNSHPNGQVEILIQNRGNETLVNTAVTVSTPSGDVVSNINFLPAKDVKTLRVSVPSGIADGGARYDTRVTLTSGARDAKPSNDRRVDTYAPRRRN